MIPNELLQEIKLNCCVLFLGSGISTERVGLTTEAPHCSKKFVDHIKEQCNYPKRATSPTFPDVMQYYCDRFDGGRKNKLIREIINWIENFSLESDSYENATAFHREIVRVPFFRIVITTNWDPFCERIFNVLVPMVEDRDIPFWDEEKRQVLKIHGCVTRPQTIIATREDYEKCINDKPKGAVFTRLRDLMATKTFIFIGFSISDPDFQLIYDEVISNLGEFRRGSWVIDPSPDERAVNEWGKRGVNIIKISGIAFAHELTKRLEEDKVIPAKELVDRYYEQSRKIVEVHLSTCDKQDTSGGFASSMYQDGLLHSIHYIIEKSAIGKSLDDLKDKLNECSRELQNMQRRLKYSEKRAQHNKIGYILAEIAYLNGWVEPLTRFIANNKREIPMYFNPVLMQPVKRPVYF